MSFLLLDSEHFAGMTRDQWEEWLRERLIAFADNASSLVDRGRITAIVHGEAKHITDISFRALPKRRDPTIERERNQPLTTDSAVEPEVAANSDFEGRLSEREGTVSRNSGFTPGPWRIDGDSNGIHIRPGRSGHIVAFISTNWVLYGAGGGDAHANARLIAAAPDLLEACEAALLIDESDSASVDPAEIFAGIRAAIVKASGVAPSTDSAVPNEE